MGQPMLKADEEAVPPGKLLEKAPIFLPADFSEIPDIHRREEANPRSGLLRLLMEAAAGLCIEQPIGLRHFPGIPFLLLPVISGQLRAGPGARMGKAVDTHLPVKIKGPAVGRRNELQRPVAHRALEIIVRQRQKDVPPEKEARKGNAAASSHKRFPAERPVSTIWPHTGALQPLPLLVHHPGGMEGKYTIRMRLHVIHLPLQLIGVAPVIIAVQHGHIFSAGSRNVEEPRDVHLPLTVLVLCPENGPDDVRIAAVVVPDHRLSAVGGGIVMDQDLQPEIPLLRKDAVQALRNIRSVIVGHHTDTDLKGILFFHHINRHSPIVRCSIL